ncbi:MAG: heavy metal translocating P-type ATPase [Egibacteraceae bacterium]
MTSETPDRGVQARIRSDAAGRARLVVSGGRVAAQALREGLHAIEGVRAVQLYGRTGSVVVWYDPSTTDAAVIQRTLESTASAPGGPVGIAAAPTSTGAGTAELMRLTLGGAVLGLIALRRLLGRGGPLVGPKTSAVAGAVALFSGYPFFRGAVRSLTSRRGSGTDALVAVATIASLALRENVVALVVLWLLNIGEFLAELTLRRTRQAIQELLSVGDDLVWLVRGDIEIEVPRDQLRVDDVVAVYTHRRIPVDGVVVHGEGLVDQAAVTGEPLPVWRAPGDEVYAGTVVGRGSIRVRATKVGMDTVVGRIIQRIEEAQAARAPIETIAERFSRRFVPVSFALAGATYLLTRDARRAMTMLLVACPCAAGLSTPTAISAAIGNAARRGTLIKGGTHLEGAGRIDAVVFDKTGTLTVGRPLITDVIAVAEDHSPEQVLALAASGEIHARHPLAEAVVRHTEQRRIQIPVHEQCDVVLGMGMRADLQGNRLLVGSPRLMAEYDVTLSQAARRWIRQFTDRGEAPICVALNERLIGLLGVTDAIRADSAETLAELRQLGVRRLLMLTGDNPDRAQNVAEHLGLGEFWADALPEEKLAVVQRLQADGYVVAMVGDGTNDGPALALADVGIAMGASGSDVALETADIALASDDLRQVASLIRLGRHTLGVVRQNYALAIGVNVIGLVAGALGSLSPVLAAILHNASSVAVVANSARLIGYRDPVTEGTRGMEDQATCQRPAPRR